MTINNTVTDILAFGAHPDDIELSCGGTLIASIAQGKKVTVIDITQGELGTRGTIATRKKEAENASRIMGITARENLQLADGFFEINEASLRKVIIAIRKYRPQIILCNAFEDRHPDHGKAGELVAKASFLSGLRRIETTVDGLSQESWRAVHVYHYIQDTYLEPDFVFDITDYEEQKIQAVLCYTTQFNAIDDDEPQTYISNPSFLDSVKSRALMMGKKIGVKYGEGFMSRKKPGINDFNNLIN